MNEYVSGIFLFKKKRSNHYAKQFVCNVASEVADRVGKGTIHRSWFNQGARRSKGSLGLLATPSMTLRLMQLRPRAETLEEQLCCLLRLSLGSLAKSKGTYSPLFSCYLISILFPNSLGKKHKCSQRIIKNKKVIHGCLIDTTN